MDNQSASQTSTSFVEIPFNPGRILRAVARIGYTPESAICDIVDNSVTAHATSVCIELERDPSIAESRRNSAARYVIADNGDGMDGDKLLAALGLGVDGEYGPGSLGKYGLGLKSAGLSQGDRIEVISGSGDGTWNKAILDLPHIEATGRLECIVEQPTQADKVRLQRLLPSAAHGTMVTVEKIHKRNHPSIRKTREALRKLLGVTYYYFLSAEDGSLSVRLDGDEVAPFDPLFVNQAELNGGLNEKTWDGKDVRWLQKPITVPLDPQNQVFASLEATQLIHPPAFENPAEVRKEYMISAQNYGFYVYRNKRLIRWAERFGGMIPTDQAYFAFRARLLIDDSADDALNIDVKKSDILLSEEAEDALSEAIYEPRRLSKHAWDNAGELLKRIANQDPISKAAEALSEVEFADTLPTDPDDAASEGLRKQREHTEAEKRPIHDSEREQVQRGGYKVVLVDQLDDNALWERAYDAALGTIVRINRGHRFTRMFYDRFGHDADVVLLVHALFLSLAVAESHSFRKIRNISEEDIEDIFQRYRNEASAAVHSVTSEALEQQLI